jgi:hypothetical protein
MALAEGLDIETTFSALPAPVAAIPAEFRPGDGRSTGRSPPEPHSPTDPTLPHRPAPTPGTMVAACKLQASTSTRLHPCAPPTYGTAW